METESSIPEDDKIKANVLYEAASGLLIKHNGNDAGATALLVSNRELICVTWRCIMEKAADDYNYDFLAVFLRILPKILPPEFKIGSRDFLRNLERNLEICFGKDFNSRTVGQKLEALPKMEETRKVIRDVGSESFKMNFAYSGQK